MLSKEVQESLMKVVIDEVSVAIEEGNSPFAAILIDKDGNIIFKAHNTAKSKCNPVLHAEINLISEACQKLKTRDLSEYAIMSNAWSCSMCMSACIKAKINTFYYGAPSEGDMNPNVSIFDIQKKCTTDLNITIGILEDECRKQIENARRKK